MADDMKAKAGTERIVKVVLIDDDPLFRESIERNLEDSGYKIRAFPDGPSALTALADGVQSDIVLLDWKMPGMNGIEVLRQLRRAGNEVPVILLTVLSDQIYEEAALLGGAVDFVEKSKSFAILQRRMELALATPGSAGGQNNDQDGSADRLVLGSLGVRRKSGRVTWRGAEVPLTLREFKIVELLADRNGSDVGYREIYDKVRGDGFHAGMGEDGYRQNVRTFVKRIRQKFRDLDDEFESIENYPGYGYRWRVDSE